MRGEWDKVNNDVLWSEDNPKRQLIVQAARARLWQGVSYGKLLIVWKSTIWITLHE